MRKDQVLVIPHTLERLVSAEVPLKLGLSDQLLHQHHVHIKVSRHVIRCHPGSLSGKGAQLQEVRVLVEVLYKVTAPD